MLPRMAVSILFPGSNHTINRMSGGVAREAGLVGGAVEDRVGAEGESEEAMTVGEFKAFDPASLAD